MAPVVSVVICTHNRAGFLAKAVGSVVAQSLSKESFELLVIDNCSTDNTRSVVESFAAQAEIRYIFEPRLGLSWARNTGWEQARGRYVAYLDDDAVAREDWLGRIVENFESLRPTPGCMGGKVEPIWEVPRPDWLSDELAHHLTIHDRSPVLRVVENLDEICLVGANMAFPRAVLQDIGGFCASLGRSGNKLLSNEELLVQRRICAAGFELCYDPAILVRHHVPSARLNRRWFLNRSYWQGISDAAMRVALEDMPRWRQVYAGIRKIGGVVLRPTAVLSLLVARDRQSFHRKCKVLASLGYASGMLRRKAWA